MRTSPNRYSAYLEPPRRPPYALLTFLIMAAMVGAGIISLRAQAAQTSQSGAYTVQAVVSGPRPTQPAVITSPANGQTFQANPITVTGTCPAGTLIKVFKNGILAGSSLCEVNGHFSFPIDLLVGTNALTAAAYNTNDQAGPDSPTVNVTLNVPAGTFGFSNELVLQSTNYYRGVMPGMEVIWPITIVGGVAPYAVSFDWGDGTSDLSTRLSSGPFTLNHTYKKIGGYLGSYPLIIRATDSAGHTAYLQLTTIVNDPTASTASATKKNAFSSVSLVIVWPLLIFLLLLVFAFWLGERREKHIMERQLAAVA